MTDEQINIAIAEMCGWVEDAADVLGPEDYPDYCNDLNAMHEAERCIPHIPHHLCWAYAAELSEIVERETRLSVFWLDQQPECATARQRAEAFLRTLGKWEESK